MKRSILAASLMVASAPLLAAIECSDVEYSQSVLNNFPEVEQACREVVERHGEEFVKISANVYDVKRSTQDGHVQRVTLNLLDANDERLQRFAFQPARDFSYEMDGKTMTAEQMARGQNLRIYIPPDRWEIAWNIEDATPIDTSIYIEDLDTRLVSITLEADEAFAFDSDELSATGKADLDAVLASLEGYVPTIKIFGYTDRIGADDYNMDLSQRRANSAKAYLESQGVPESRITAVGRGSTQPIVECEGLSGDELKDCLEPNRRVSVFFVAPGLEDTGIMTVTKTYMKPDGEKVVVEEKLAATQIAEVGDIANEINAGCAVETENYCSDVRPGGGRTLSCLMAHATPEYDFSDRCTDALVDAADAIALRRERLNLVGGACSAELAACTSTPVGQKLTCIASNEMSEVCAEAMALLPKGTM